MSIPSLSVLAVTRLHASFGTLVLTDVLLFLAVAGLVAAVFQLMRVSRRLDLLEQRLGAVLQPPAPAAVPPPAVAAASRAQPAEEGLPSELAALIAAACHAAVGQSARIVSIAEASDLHRVWSIEGRRQIFASHQIR